MTARVPTMPATATTLRHRALWMLLAAVVALWLWASPASAKIYLVAVGISDYPGNSNDLRLPAADAKTVSWLYGRNAAASRIVLTDSQATAANIISAMNSLFANARADDIIVLFFSGHGVKGAFMAYDKRLTYTKIIEAMAKSKARNKIIFADACYAGKMRGDSGSSGDGESAIRNANVMLFLSSRSNETSLEKRSMDNGLFTTYLVRALRGGADTNGDRTITARELYEYVHKKVIKASGDRQHPVMWGNFANTMPVMVW